MNKRKPREKIKLPGNSDPWVGVLAFLVIYGSLAVGIGFLTVEIVNRLNLPWEGGLLVLALLITIAMLGQLWLSYWLDDHFEIEDDKEPPME